jgi:acyl carrier protein
VNKTVEQIVDFMKQEIESISLGAKPAAEISENDELMADLGLDSLDYAAVMITCETWLGVKVNEAAADWRRLKTVAQLSAFLHAHQQAPQDRR